MQAACELVQVVERAARAGRVRDPGVRRRSASGRDAGQRLGEPGQPPLRPLAQTGLEPAPLLVRRRRAGAAARPSARPACACTSAWSATLEADSRVADATASTSAGSRSTAASWTSTANGRPSRSTSVAERPESGSGRSSAAARVVEVGARLRRPVADLERRVAEGPGEPIAKPCPTSSPRVRPPGRRRPRRPGRAGARTARRRPRPARLHRRAAPGRRRRRRERPAAPPHRRRAPRRARRRPASAVSRSRLADPAATRVAARGHGHEGERESTIVATSLLQTGVTTAADVAGRDRHEVEP